MTAFACVVCAAVVIAAHSPQTTSLVDVTLTEGTSMAAAVSPDRRWIAIDLLGCIWVLPFRGGEANKITPDLLEAHQPTWSRDSQTIAFQGYDDGTWHVYAIGQDGEGLKRLTDGVFDDREPVWSHDGTRIAFSSDRYGGISTIWELNVTTRGLRQLTTRDSWAPTWSPNDEEITFVSIDRPPATGRTPGTAQVGLWAVGTDGRERLLMMSAIGTPVAPAWDPSGTVLAYTVAGQLIVGGRLVAPNEDAFPFRPQWTSRTVVIYTADGHIKRRSVENGLTSTIPFSAKVSLQRAQYTIQPRALESREPQPLTGIVAPAVSPDGRAIAYVAMGDIWILPIGDRPVQVTNDSAVELDPAWSPDGKVLAFSSDRAGRMDLWSHDFRTNEERQLTDRGGVTGAAWSPDGNHIAFLVNRREVAAVTLRPDTHHIRFEARWSGGELGRPTWAPDNESIAFGGLFPYSDRYREGLNQIELLTFAPAGQFSSLLFPGHSAGNREYDGPVWSPDGFRMAFVSEGTLWTVPIDGKGAATGPPRAIATDHPASPSWEADSQHIVYQTPDGLRRVIADGGDPIPIPLNLQWKAAPPPARVVVHAGHVFDGVFDGLRGESDIVVDGGVIREITGHNDDLHRGAIVDASEETVMPGFCDMHAHLDADYGENFGKVWLAYGITTVRIPGVNPYAGLELREAFDAGRRPGPRVFIAGDRFDGVRLYEPGGVSIASDLQLGDQLDRGRDLGIDFFTTYVRLPDRWQRSVVEFAHALGKPVTSNELYPAVALGVDGVEHLRGVSRRGYSPKASSTNRAYRDVIDLIAKSGITLTPTIGIEGGFTAREIGDKNLLFDPRLAFYPRSIVAMLADLSARPPSAELDAVLKPYEATLKSIAAAGGRIVAGTDSPIVPYGLGLHAELDSYVHAGLTPFQALQAATINAAQALGLEHELGTIEVGKLADVTFVGGDPLQDIRNARDVKRVMRGGRIYTLNDLLPRH